MMRWSQRLAFPVVALSVLGACSSLPSSANVSETVRLVVTNDEDGGPVPFARVDAQDQAWRYQYLATCDEHGSVEIPLWEIRRFNAIAVWVQGPPFLPIKVPLSRLVSAAEDGEPVNVVLLSYKLSFGELDP